MADFRTISEFIQSGSTEPITYHSTSITDIIDDIECPYYNVVYDYLEELTALSVKVKLSPKEYQRYKYRPDLLSYDVYGTDKFDFVILALNNTESDKLFDTDVLYLIPQENMLSVMNYIFNSETDYLNFSKQKTDPTLIEDKKYEL